MLWKTVPKQRRSNSNSGCSKATAYQQTLIKNVFICHLIENFNTFSCTYSFNVTMLRCYDATLLPCYGCVWTFLHVPNEIRLLSHGITAAFGVQLGGPLYTERNETAFGVLLDTERNRAVNSWNNGRVWCSSMY